MEDIKKTAGKTILEHVNNNPGLDDDIIEYRKAMEPEIIRHIYAAAQEARNKDLYIHKDFYIVFLMTNDHVLRFPRIMIFARASCPTPTYQQSVWKYLHKTDTLEFLWSIPDKILYYHILHNKTKYLADEECRGLAQFIILMETGELLEWVKKENGELIDAVIKISEEEEPIC